MKWKKQSHQLTIFAFVTFFQSSMMRSKSKKKVRMILQRVELAHGRFLDESLTCFRSLFMRTDSPDANGTDLMRKVPVKNGSVVGVAVQQSDRKSTPCFC